MFLKRILRNPPKLMALLLMTFPVIIVIFMVHKYAVNFPSSWDEWFLLGLIEKFYTDDLTFYDFWILYDDHRPFVASSFFVFLMSATRFNVLWGMYVNIVIVAIILFLIVRHVTKNRTIFAINNTYRWLWVIIPLFVFSLVQVECWLWALESNIFLNILAVVSSAYIFSNFRYNLMSFIGLVCCAFVATFTRGNGLGLWICILYVLILSICRDTNKKTFYFTFAWCIAFTATAVSYFYGFKIGEHVLNRPGVFSEPLQYLDFILKFIGAPLSFYSENIAGRAWLRQNNAHMIFWGVLGTILFTVLLFSHAFLKNFHKEKPWSFFYIIGLYVIISAALTAYGRMFIGTFAASTPRYTTTSIYLWLSVFILLFSTNISFMKKNRTWNRIFRLSKMLIAAIIFIAMAWTSFNSVKSFKLIRKNKQHMYSHVFHDEGTCFEDNEDCFLYYVDFIHRMHKLGLSFFKDRPPPVTELFQKNLILTGDWQTIIEVKPAKDFDFSAAYTSRDRLTSDVGTIVSGPIDIDRLETAEIKFKVIHSQNTTNQKIGMQVNKEQPITLLCPLDNPAETWQTHTFDLSEYSGNTFTFFAEDNGKKDNEWIGFFIPLMYYKTPD